jgi:hypothetical protein
VVVTYPLNCALRDGSMVPLNYIVLVFIFLACLMYLMGHT